MKKGLVLVLVFSAIALPVTGAAHDRGAHRHRKPDKLQKDVVSGTSVVSQVSVCPEVLSFKLEPNQEVPPTNSSADGSCVGLLQADRTNLTVSCAHNVVQANAAHIHNGAPGVNGPIICPAANAESPLTISCSLDPTLRTALEAGNLYVNVHSPTFPNGEIRGQVPVPLLAACPATTQGSLSQSSQSSQASLATTY